VKQKDEAVAQLVADVAPSIVAVSVLTPEGARRGTGVCVRHAGDVLTSDRLVRGARRVTVTTSDGQTQTATVRGHDPTTDLALLRVTGGLDAAPVAGNALRAGDSVIAVGTSSVGGKDPWIGTGIVASTEGVVSNLGGPAMDGMIATNAWAGKDGLGGALLDRQGGVAGILIAPIMGDSSSYAVPIAFAGEIADQLSTKGTAAHGWLGVTGKDVAGAPTLTGTTANGPAARAGIRAGDVVVSVGERIVTTMGEVTAAVSWYDPHATVGIKVRRAGTLVKAEVTLGTAPPNAMVVGA
jgi:S1-C subfamily serine protease